MKINEGLGDRLIRVALGLAVLSLLAIGPVPGWAWPASLASSR